MVVQPHARAQVVAALSRRFDARPLLCICATSNDAERLHKDLEVLVGGDEVELFPAWETLPFERISPTVETMGQRLKVMWRLAEPLRWPKIVVASARSVIQRLGHDVELVTPVEVSADSRVDRDALVASLVEIGYRRVHQVESRGEVAVRGSIVDVYGPTNESPVRVDLFGDEIDRLCRFALSDQRSGEDLSSELFFGCREIRLDQATREIAQQLLEDEPWGAEHWERLAEGLYFDGMESWLPFLSSREHLLSDLIPSSGQVVLLDPSAIASRVKEMLSEEESLAESLSRSWISVDGRSSTEPPQWPRLHLAFERLLAHNSAPVLKVLSAPQGRHSVEIESSGFPSTVGEPDAMAMHVRRLLDGGYSVVVAADGAGSAQRLSQALLRCDVVVAGVKSLPTDLAASVCYLVVASMSGGCAFTGLKLALVAESDLTGRRRAHRARRAHNRRGSTAADELAPGDYAVHHQHGVGRFQGVVRKRFAGTERDYLLLEYKRGDKLYVPTDQVGSVLRYSGGESPTLNTLGSGSDWARTKAKVRSAAQEVAQELIVLYRTRAAQQGNAFALDTPWQAELEEAFEYEETPDQLEAIEAVKRDMESPTPMDRLVCGDVGFGKTEVALRAVFKCVQEGMQAGILVPTTLLAQQHFATFTDRFSPYPIRVEVLSRFLSNAQAAKVVAGIGDGSVDVVIGTHRLLSKDIAFKKLGLLVVDEEQRFGVKHKESIKQFKADVDVLTLSATPIPRTLEMSLTGIRDLSLLRTPPTARQPILTHVGEHDERAVAEAIRRELLREGQVFFVHNRVRDIEHVAVQLKDLVPEARIAIAHGQMDEGTLEQVVLDFWEGKYDVLVCTTIIEAGIDMPTVNTLVVDRADLMGLGQLHQLRGRVGRAGQRAYAYLFFPKDRELSEQAYERLKTVGEATDLGAGFRIAMRDLELRGAGNLLGNTQSGHIAAVGYDLYVQMVTEEVAQLKGEEVSSPPEIKIDVPGKAFLPEDYVPTEAQRLEGYRRIATASNLSDVGEIEAEWVDRFGPLPEEAIRLLKVGRLRAQCARLAITDAIVSKGTARVSPVVLPMSAEVRLRRLNPRALYKGSEKQLVIPLRSELDAAQELAELLAELLPNDEGDA